MRMSLKIAPFAPQAGRPASPPLGDRLASFLRRFGRDLTNRPIRAALAVAITEAVCYRNFANLCDKLELFGDTCEGREMDFIDQACRREAAALIACLDRTVPPPWDDLNRALAIPEEIRSGAAIFPRPKEINRGRELLLSALVQKSNLTKEAQARLAEAVYTRQGVWGDPKETIRSVVQSGDRIIIDATSTTVVLEI
jgi:hypothetical protein